MKVDPSSQLSFDAISRPTKANHWVVCRVCFAMCNPKRTPYWDARCWYHEPGVDDAERARRMGKTS